MNLRNEDDRNRLFKAIEQSYRKLEPFRNLNASLVEEYAGSSYGQPGGASRFETMVNLMNQAVDAYTMSLVANRPRVVIDTNRQDRKYFAKHFTVAVNNMIQEMGLENVLRKWVVNAFFSLGIVKVHRADTVAVKLYDGRWVDPGTPMASIVSLDDWVHDMSATRWDQIKFAADSYRVPLEYLQGDQFDQEVVRQLQPTNRQSYGSFGDRAESLSKGHQTEQDDVLPMVDLMDVWIPFEGMIYTIPVDPSSPFVAKFPPVAEMEWDSPEDGPYQYLSFTDVPDNLMPSSPASHLSTLARLVNNLLRKQAQQARRQKEIYPYTPEGAESAKLIQKTSDGMMVRVQGKGDIGVMKMGGVDPGNQAFTINAIELFDRMAGNLPAMLGLGPQADTLGQEQLIAGSVSKKEAQLRYKCLDATRKLVRNLAYMLWKDSAKVIPGRMPIPGLENETIDATWTPEYRMGDFYDYDLDIDVFSMAYQPPESKVRALNQLLTQIYIPMGQLLQTQGGELDLQALTDIYAELMHLPRLKEVVKFAAPQVLEQQTALGLEKPPMPAQTERSYVRRNVAAGGTPQSRSMSQQQAWLGMAGQGNQAAMMNGGGGA